MFNHQAQPMMRLHCNPFLLLVVCLLLVLSQCDEGDERDNSIHQSGGEDDNDGLHRITLSMWKNLHQRTTPAPTMVTKLYGPFRKVLHSQLPMDQEVSAILTKDKDTRFFFSLPRNTSTLRLIVSPCEGQVAVRLTRVSPQAMKRFRRSHKSMENRLKRFLTKSHAKLDRTLGERFEWQEVTPRDGFYILQLTPIDPLVGYLYTRLYLSTSLDSIYPRLPPVATVLAKQIESKQTEDGEFKLNVELAWNPVVEDNQPEGYQYCLLISEGQRHRDNCLLNNEAMQIFLGADREASISRDPDDQSEPWHQEARRLLSKLLEREYREKVVHTDCQFGTTTKTVVGGLKPSVMYFVDVFVRDRETRLSSRYWTSNFTLALPNPKRTSKAAVVPFDLLMDSQDTGVSIDGKSGYRKLMLYRSQPQSNEMPLEDWSGRLYLFVQPCAGLGPIQMIVRPRVLPEEANIDRHKRQSGLETIYMPEDIIEDQQLDRVDKLELGALLVEEIAEAKTFEVVLPEWFQSHNETHFVEFEFSLLTTQQAHTLVVFVSSTLSKFPYPRMPTDRSIRALETLRNCSSISLVWNASPDDRVLYCIMQRDANEKHASFQESKPLCQLCAPVVNNKRALTDDYALTEYAKPTRQVVCRRFQASKRRTSRNLIMQNVRKLEPGRRYVFQVIITKAKGRSLAYEQVWTATNTREHCWAGEEHDTKRRRKSDRSL